MTRINRKVEYALIALKYMSSKFAGQLTTVKEICEATGVPFDATARVMQVMAQNGVMKSEQGARGGYILIQDLSKVSYQDLSNMILGPIEIAKCIQVGGECEIKDRCNIVSPIHHLNQKLASFYSTLSIQDLLGAR